MATQKFTEVELRVMEIQIKKHGFWEKLVERGRFEVKLFSVVSDGVPDNTFHLELGVFSVKDGGVIQFGPYGYALYRNRAGQIPRYLDCYVAIVEDDSDIRMMANFMSEVRKSNEFKSLANALLFGRLNPVMNIGLNVAGSLLDIGLNILKNNGDDLWHREYFTFNYRIDGYEGKFEMDSDDAKARLSMFTA